MFGKSHFNETWSDIDEVEFNGFIGVLVLIALHKHRQEPVHELFSVNEGREIYRQLFSYGRFTKISRALHFDNFNTRIARKNDEKFCPIRKLWDMWIDILPKCFALNQDVTVDEQLVSFKERCPSCQCMSMKPAKYGIKFFFDGSYC